MTTFEGKCGGRRLRVSVDDDFATVESLSGHQAGSVFMHPLTELKKKPDVVVDSTTWLYSLGFIAALLSGFLAIMCALHWGEGITVRGFWINIAIFAVGVVAVRSAPKRKTYLWTTVSGVQAFGLEESKKNQQALQQFRDSLEASIMAKQ